MPTRAPLLQLESELIQAMQAGDIQGLDSFLHDDLLFVIPSGQTITKQMDLDNYRKGLITIDFIEVDEIELSEIGENGIVSSKLCMSGAFRQEPFSGTFKYIRIWKAIDGSWQVIGGAGMQLRE